MYDGLTEIKIGKYNLEFYFTKQQLIFCVLIFILGGGLNFMALLLGWQGLPDTLATRTELVSMIIIFGIIGYALGRIDIGTN